MLDIHQKDPNTQNEFGFCDPEMENQKVQNIIKWIEIYYA